MSFTSGNGRNKKAAVTASETHPANQECENNSDDIALKTESEYYECDAASSDVFPITRFASVGSDFNF